mgnify:CR=1 FL=1
MAQSARPLPGAVRRRLSRGTPRPHVRFLESDHDHPNRDRAWSSLRSIGWDAIIWRSSRRDPSVRPIVDDRVP